MPIEMPWFQWCYLLSWQWTPPSSWNYYETFGSVNDWNDWRSSKTFQLDPLQRTARPECRLRWESDINENSGILLTDKTTAESTSMSPFVAPLRKSVRQASQIDEALLREKGCDEFTRKSREAVWYSFISDCIHKQPTTGGREIQALCWLDGTYPTNRYVLKLLYRHMSCKIKFELVSLLFWSSCWLRLSSLGRN